MRARRTVLGAAALLIVLTGCGGDPLADRIEEDGVQAYSDAGDDTTTTTTTTTTTAPPTTVGDPRADYLAAGDAICVTLGDRIRTLVQGDNLADALVANRANAEAMRRAADHLGILTPPDPTWQAHLQDGIGGLRQAAGLLDSLADAAAGGHAEAARQWADRALPVLREVQLSLSAAGLARCA